MYKQFYLMEKEPFDIHPSPELFYKSNAHQNGWGYLYQGIKSNEPILLVTGEYGTGKTLLCLRLIKLLKALKKRKKMPSVYLSTPTYDFTRVLEKIIVALNISMDGVDTSKEAKLQQLIYDYFEAPLTQSKEKFIYLVIDDAQDFSYSFINKLRLLCSYNVSGEFPIRLILFAHQDFFGTLNDKKNAAMAQRIRRIYRLNPFDFEDTREYIYFRLTYSGASGAPVFNDDAIGLIQKASRGIPRMINNICDNCLLVASNERLNEINESMVTEAIKMGHMVGVADLQKYESFNSKDESHHDHDVVADESIPSLPSFSEERKEIEGDVVHHPHLKKESRQYRENRVSENEQSGKLKQHDESTYVDRDEDELPPDPEINGKKRLQQNISKYAKKGIIIVLLMIILYLLFYIFSQKDAGADSDIQSACDQNHSFVTGCLYDVDDMSSLKKDHIPLLNLRVIADDVHGVMCDSYPYLQAHQICNDRHKSITAYQGEYQC